jgi:hypothetical protein
MPGTFGPTPSFMSICQSHVTMTILDHAQYATPAKWSVVDREAS